MVHYIDSFPGREITINEEKYLYFGGTAYLGLQTDSEFQELLIDNIKKYGTNYGASRKSNIRLGIFDKAEAYLAELVGSESCITMSSGYLAGQFVTQFLDQKEHTLFYTPNTHSALYVAISAEKKPKSYITCAALNIALRDHLEHHKTTPVVFLDAIDFSGANYPNFEGLQMLPLSELILVVDDSHGIGVVGEKGAGVYKKIKELQPKELMVCCSLGKGFGVQAGAIFGTTVRLLELKDSNFFGGASPASPAHLASIVHGEKIYTTKRVRLEGNTHLFLENLNHPIKFKYMEGHPAFSFVDEKLTSYLEKKHIIVTSFRYPNDNSNLMSRIVISAAHTKADILKICDVINDF